MDRFLSSMKNGPTYSSVSTQGDDEEVTGGVEGKGTSKRQQGFFKVEEFMKGIDIPGYYYGNDDDNDDVVDIEHVERIGTDNIPIGYKPNLSSSSSSPSSSSSSSCWTVFDYSNWIAIGIYVMLMAMVPLIRQESNSLVLFCNAIIFLVYVYWYSWFGSCTKNEAVKCLAFGFYLSGLTMFVIGLVIYFFVGVPTAVSVYQSYFTTTHQSGYQVALECFLVAFFFTGLLQEGLKYQLLFKTSSLEYLAFDDRVASNQIIGASIGIGIGSVLSTLMFSLLIFEMSWLSRMELWCLAVCWQIPLTICTSYIVGAGVADRELLQIDISVFAVLCMPVFYTTLAYFQEFLVIAFHPSIFVRFLAMLASMVMNLIIVSAAGLDVWQRISMLKRKHLLRARRVTLDSSLSYQ